MYAPHSQLHFAENPIEIGQLVPHIWALERYQKQKETKDIFCFVWLYLKINIPNFWLILLNHITYVDYVLLGWCQPSIDKTQDFWKVCSKNQQKNKEHGYHWPLSQQWNETHEVICHKLVLKSVSYPKIVENTPILIEQSIACNVYT